MSYMQGYHWSAVTRRHYWYLHRYEGPYFLTFAARAVQDYVNYYKITSPQKKGTVIIDLCTAILLAVDSGKYFVLS